MSDKEALTPRVFLVRHGETTWAKSGRSTGTTDIELTQVGVSQVLQTATKLVGAGKLLEPCRLAHVFVSPRVRAVKTFELLMSSSSGLDAGKVTYTEEIAEWDYGDYEGLKDDEIRSLRQEKGLDLERRWNIWSDGCEGGESQEQVTKRLDELISQIREMQRPYMHGEKPVDILLVAHGLILRCFVKRWLGLAVEDPIELMLLPGAVTILSYKKNNVNQPALHVGVAIPPEENQEV